MIFLPHNMTVVVTSNGSEASNGMTKIDTAISVWEHKKQAALEDAEKQHELLRTLGEREDARRQKYAETVGMAQRYATQARLMQRTAEAMRHSTRAQKETALAAAATERQSRDAQLAAFAEHRLEKIKLAKSAAVLYKPSDSGDDDV